MSSDYVSLHNHTTFSLMDSLIKPVDLFKRVKELGQSAVAVTDHGTLSGAWDCLKYSRDAGVKLIMGCEFYFIDDYASDTNRLRHIILLAKNGKGYRNLLSLNKYGFDNLAVVFKKAVPRIDWKGLEKHGEGLICTTACGGGILSQLINTRKLDEAKKQAIRLKDIFGESLALEIQPHSMKRVANLYKDYEDQAFTNHQLIKLGQELNIKVIAATDAHYLTPEEHDAHDVMLAIGSGQPIGSGNRLKYSAEFHVKSREEVKAAFAKYGAKADEFCDNTLFFADMCEKPDWIDPKFYNPSGKELPEFPVQDQENYSQFKTWLGAQSDLKKQSEDVSYLRYWAAKGFEEKLAEGKLPADRKEEYWARAEEEFDVLEYHGFSSYMLIVADFIDWCRKQNIRVGPGRGSVGGSLVAHLIGIHQADPIKYGLIFARFHNKEKTSFPDIDCDFAPSGRDQLQAYIRQKYGEDRVAHVSNIMTMKPKVYARDIARVFQFGGDPKAAVAIGTVLADSIPKDIKTVDEALESAPLFKEFANTPKYEALKKYAPYLGSKAKAWSTHAAGLVIGRTPLVEIVPLRRDKDYSIAIEYEKERAEANGLVKMDTLGLETLDIISQTYKLIEMSGKALPPDPPNFDEYDEKTYDLISRGDTVCVFQLGGSAGTVDLCRRIKPRNIEDISIINALARPSARDMRGDFIQVRSGEKPMELIDPSLSRSFGGTYGFGLYEECLMFLAKDVANWDLHAADRLRKLTKDKGKDPKKAEKLRKEFVDNSVANGIAEKIAMQIWDEVVDKFQGYGFNKSHSILYSLISYHTAYLKAHFPLEFLTANLMSEVTSNAANSGDNINRIKSEIRKLNVRIVPPDINKSEVSYKIVDAQTLITGLDALKYMGKDAIPEILSKRPFSNFENFLSSVDGKKVRAPAVQALAASGCLDSFRMTRKQMFLYASDFKKKLQVWLKKKHKDGETFNYPWPDDREDWTIAQKYALERYYIGEGLSGNKIQAYPGFFNSAAPKFATFPEQYPDPGDPNESYRIPPFQAEVIGFFEFKVKKENSKSFGKPMAKVMLEDPWGTPMMMTVFPKQWANIKERVKILTGGKSEFVPGIAIFASGNINWYEGDISIIFEDLLKCDPPPPLPSDLKPKKVSMRTSRARKKIEEMEVEDLIEAVEDGLIEDGLIKTLEEDEYDFEEFDPESNLDGFNS